MRVVVPPSFLIVAATAAFTQSLSVKAQGRAVACVSPETNSQAVPSSPSVAHSASAKLGTIAANGIGHTRVGYWGCARRYLSWAGGSRQAEEVDRPNKGGGHPEGPMVCLPPLIGRIPQCRRADARSVAGHLDAAAGQMVVAGHRREQL